MAPRENPEQSRAPLKGTRYNIPSCLDRCTREVQRACAAPIESYVQKGFFEVKREVVLGG
jgi:hypothetical protein